MQRLASLLPEYDVVMAMQGAGPITGPQLMAEIGDVRRFTSKGALVAFAGVDAPPFQSGAFDSKSRHVSKRGSPHLRRVLFTICSVLLQQANPENAVFQFMDRKRAEGKHIDVSQQTIDYMRQGMSATTQEGGTAAYFSQLPKPIAGKTGTAENSHGRDHGLFVAYGPVEDPELVVVCIVEQGGFGSTAAGPIVYKAFEEFFKERGWMPEQEPEKESLNATADSPAVASPAPSASSATATSTAPAQ